MSDSQGPGQREVAYRLFAAEFEDSDLSYSESDEERAPNYVVTPTGARVNRLFAVGVLTEVESVSEDVLRGRVVDPTGAFVLYAGQYQPDEQAFLERAEPPVFVAVTGKARTFQPEDSERVFTSVRPETLSEVDADTRDRWTVAAAEQTLDRVGQMAAAKRLDARGDDLEAALRERGLPEGLAEGIPLALDHYGTTGEYLGAVRAMALEAARLVAGEADEVEPLALAPGDGGDGPLAELAAGDLPTRGAPEPEAAVDTTPDATADETPAGTDAGPGAETGTEADTETGSAAATGPDDGESAAGTPGEAGETVEDETEDLGDFDPGEFELDEEEREEIEAEYGTDFQSGTEVDEPGEADIETPEPDPDLEPAEDATAERADDATDEQATDETEATTTEGTEGTDDTAEATPADDAPSGPEETVDAVVEVMTELDDGDGADRGAVVDAMGERYGASPEEVEDAIQEALMDGRCYEPDDGALKPI